jgi:hypothetical protein
LFTSQGDVTTVSALDLREAEPGVLASASLSYRIRVLLAAGLTDPEAIAKKLDAKLETVKRVLRRIRAGHEGADNA